MSRSGVTQVVFINECKFCKFSKAKDELFMT